MRSVVIALGGNAIAPKGKMAISSQFSNVRKTMECVLPVIKNHHAVVTHGNGPQVGNILIRVEEALGKAYPIPLSIAVAESEGEMGYIIDQSLVNLLLKKNIRKPVLSVLTQVVVDKNDPAFRSPAKPVGPFYSKAEAAKMKKKGLHVALEQGKGWRRVVPSPQPKAIVEAEIIKKISREAVVIAAGGGGIPVVETKQGYKGIDAVIDKDLASACLAISMKADLLLILTDVTCAYKNFGRKNQKPIKSIDTRGRFHAGNEEGRISSEFFSAGGMLPKVNAGLWFARNNGTAIITNPQSLQKALSGKAGTIITK